MKKPNSNDPIQMINKFLIHYGELGLKGANRKDFEYQLRRNILAKIRDIDTEAELEIKHKYFELRTSKNTDPQKVTARIKKVFGISWFTQATELPRESELKKISQKILELASHQADSQKTFKVSCKRADKRYPKTSPEIEKFIGREIIQNTDYNKVDLTDPDDAYFIEIEHDTIYVFDKKIQGLEGLPVGTSGRALVLLSGGIDSPVAAYMMAKRGCNIDFLNFYVNKPEKSSQIVKLASKIAEYTNHSLLIAAPYIHFNLAVSEIDTQYELVLFRRFMLRIAQKLCEENNYEALVTGDNLGQVASQTMENIEAATDALEKTLTFRPLIGMDKKEIIRIAKDIGSFELSIEPHKDCCSIIDQNAKTRVSINRIREEEKKLKNYQQLIDKTLEEIIDIKLNPYQ